MKKHIQKFYERFYQGGKGPRVRGLGGKPLAMELGYPARLVDLLPDELWEDFLPCGNVLPYLHPKPGDRVLNLGCGVGVDSLVLKAGSWEQSLPPQSRASRDWAGEAGPVGEKRSLPPRCFWAGVGVAEDLAGFKIMNLDTSIAALVKARGLAARFFPDFDFEFVCADGEGLPFGPGSFEWIILNGVFNLFPDKSKLTAEMYRVLKPGGVVAGADLCRRTTLPGYFASEPDAWAWCMSGAPSRYELRKLFEAGGFRMLDLVCENMDEYFDRAAFVFTHHARQPCG